MCKTDYEAVLGRVGAENATNPVPKSDLPNPGDSFRMRNEQFIMRASGLLYKFTSGNPNTQYAQIDAMDGTRFIITHSKLLHEMQPAKKLFTNAGKLLAKGPCKEGMNVLASYYGASGNSMFDVTRKVASNGAISTAIPLQDLYDYAHKFRSTVVAVVGEPPVPTSWLRFVAEALDIVPNGMSHKREVLIGLLGIIE